MKGVTYQTNRLTSINDTTLANIDSTSAYNTNGYVSGISYDSFIVHYVYDDLGRLTEETNDYGTFTYAYDTNNNITSKTENGTTTSYTYDSQGRLTQCGSYTFQYDALGNPTKYKDNTFTWTQGRKLAGGTLNGNSFQYSYDGNGMRYKKVVNGTTTEYYYNGTQLLAEYNRTTKEMKYYFYDQTGIAGMIYNDSYYYFDKNTLGDVIAIRDAYGDVIAKYKYDAWGNVLQETNLYNSGMASKNPFRYRGYYYDTETGFYYLQTRYYDPEIGRFINADDYELVGTLASVPGQLNMYAYCNNNPVMYTDESGEAFFASLLAVFIGGLISGAITGAFAIANQISTNGWNPKDWNWKDIGTSVVGGFVAGMISAIPLGGWLGALGFGGAGAVVGGAITGSVNNVETFFTALTIGAVANLIGYGINVGIAKYKAGTIYNLGNKAKSLAVQQLQAHPMNMGAVALKGGYRNAFKNISQKEIQKLLMNANFWLSNSIFSSITSSSLSGWY